MSDEEMREMKEQQAYIRHWAYKKMLKYERKLLRYARIYFGEQATIIYAGHGTKVIFRDGTEIMTTINRQGVIRNEIGPISK